MGSSSEPNAPGDLELVRTFVNTLDIEKGTDALESSETWGRWCAERGLSVESSATDRQLLGELREALREGLLAHHSRGSMPLAAREVLDRMLAWSQAGAGNTDAALATLKPQIEGSRLRGASPLKPLCPVAGRPLIDHALGGLAEAGLGRA